MSYEAICVSGVRFLAIQRERGTRGQLYVVWRSYSEAFVAQTLPPLLKLVTKLTNVKLVSSGFYRILRAETAKPYSKGFYIRNLPSIEELNRFLEQFELFIVCSMDFYKWEIAVKENKDGSPSAQGTKIQL